MNECTTIEDHIELIPAILYQFKLSDPEGDIHQEACVSLIESFNKYHSLKEPPCSLPSFIIRRMKWAIFAYLNPKNLIGNNELKKYYCGINRICQVYMAKQGKNPDLDILKALFQQKYSRDIHTTNRICKAYINSYYIGLMWENATDVRDMRSEKDRMAAFECSDILETLCTPKEISILSMKFENCMTFQEIGREFNNTKQWANFTFRNIIKRLQIHFLNEEKRCLDQDTSMTN